MDKRHNEILLILQEECAEVIQAVSKIKRFGMENNREQFEQEVADVICMIDLCYQHGLLNQDAEKILDRIKIKQERLKKYSSIYETEST